MELKTNKIPLLKLEDLTLETWFDNLLSLKDRSALFVLADRATKDYIAGLKELQKRNELEEYLNQYNKINKTFYEVIENTIEHTFKSNLGPDKNKIAILATPPRYILNPYFFKKTKITKKNQILFHFPYWLNNPLDYREGMDIKNYDRYYYFIDFKIFKPKSKDPTAYIEVMSKLKKRKEEGIRKTTNYLIYGEYDKAAKEITHAINDALDYKEYYELFKKINLETLNIKY